jgi:hypothetical protein
MGKKRNNFSKRYRGGDGTINTNTNTNSNLTYAAGATNLMLPPTNVPTENTPNLTYAPGATNLMLPPNSIAPNPVPTVNNAPVLSPSDVPENTKIPADAPISLAAPILVQQALSPTPEPVALNAPTVIVLGNKKYPVEQAEIDAFIKGKEEARYKQYREEYLASKKEHIFMESLRTGSRSGNTICLGFTMLFMIAFRNFMEQNKNNLCQNPRAFYRNLINTVVENLKGYIAPGGLSRTILDLLINESNVISLILSLISIPLFPVCMTGLTTPVIDVITIAIGLITENLCTSKRIDIKNTIKEILKRIRSTKLADFYPGATLRKIKDKLANIRNRTRRAFSKEGIQSFKNKTRNKYQRFKKGVSSLRNKFTGLFRRKPQALPNSVPLMNQPINQPVNQIIGGRHTRKNYRY